VTDSAGAEWAAISRFAYSVGSHGGPVTELFRIRRVFGALHRALKVAAAGARAAEGKRHPAAVREVSLQRVYMRTKSLPNRFRAKNSKAASSLTRLPAKACPERRNENRISVVCGAWL
jgi:hypothetical protein